MALSKDNHLCNSTTIAITTNNLPISIANNNSSTISLTKDMAAVGKVEASETKAKVKTTTSNSKEIAK